MSVKAILCEGYRSDGGRCQRRTYNADRLCGYCKGRIAPGPVANATAESPVAQTAQFHSMQDRARNAARRDPRWSVQQRYRYMAFDRLLWRLMGQEGDHWVLKGGIALLARLDSARPSDDLDLAYMGGSLTDALAALADAVVPEHEDQFRFELGASSSLIEGNAQGMRVPITATACGRPWVKFHIDLTAWPTRLETMEDWVSPLAPIPMPNLAVRSYRCWPVVNHVADKVAACLERHGAGGQVSSRFRDLADLYLLATTQVVGGSELRSAVMGELNRRGVTAPTSFDVPDRRTWRAGWNRKLAPGNPQLAAAGFDRACEVVGRWLDPMLRGEACGRWDPAQCVWNTTPVTVAA